MNADGMIYLPRPRSVTAAPGDLAVKPGGKLCLVGDAAALLPSALALQLALRETSGVDLPLVAGDGRPDADRWAVIELAPATAVPAQGYRLHIAAGGLRLVARDAAGAFYGVQTLIQMLRQSPASLPGCVIEDHPDFPVRGVMLDISRDKVPTMETLFGLVEMFAAWKINHLELYTEHTFAYRHHREVWAEASPMTGEEIMRLDAFCRDRHIDLVPNQNSFGHFERWLKLARYRPLAECPDGFDAPWGKSLPPTTLDPTNPGSLELLEEMFDELLPHFSSRKFNIGCDETWELGKGRAAPAVEAKGKPRVYLEFLLKIQKLVAARGRAMHFWGDIALEHPEMIPEIPKDVVFLNWGYDADHPFEEQGAKIRAAGLTYYVCPGTSSWRSIAGETDNALANIRRAAAVGLKHGATGLLNTDWGDMGHLQYLPVSYLPFAAGAAHAWCHAAQREADLVPAVDRFAFRDAAGVMAGIARDLGGAGAAVKNGPLFYALAQSFKKAEVGKELTAEAANQAVERITGIAGRLGQARMARPDAALVVDEFLNAAAMLTHAARKAVAIRKGTITGEAVTMAGDLRRMLGEHRRLWSARNRPGGLQDSARRLSARLDEIDPHGETYI